MAGISYKASGSLENKYKYNGKELQHNEFSDGSGLETYDYGHRMQDLQLGKWGNLDHLAEKYYSISPYAYVANNPILYNDTNGDSLILNGSGSAISAINDIVYQGTGGMYTMDQGRNGKYYLNATSLNDGSASLDAKQLALVNTLNGAINSPANIAFTVIDGNSTVSNDVILGDNGKSGQTVIGGQHVIDVGDAAKLGSGGLITAQGVVGHEVKEGTEIQSRSLTTPRDINGAHALGIAAENSINGTTRINSLGVPDMVAGANPNSSILTLHVTVPRTATIPARNAAVIVNFKNGNVCSVTGNH